MYVCTHVHMYIGTYVHTYTRMYVETEMLPGHMDLSRKSPIARTGGSGRPWQGDGGLGLWAGPVHGGNRHVDRCRGVLVARERALPCVRATPLYYPCFSKFFPRCT